MYPIFGFPDPQSAPRSFLTWTSPSPSSFAIVVADMFRVCGGSFFRYLRYAGILPRVALDISESFKVHLLIQGRIYPFLL